MSNYSPLRYPGGKSKIAPLIRTAIEKTNFEDVTYIEPFAGGAGVALYLLLEGVVNRIVINDYDKAIYSFWRTIKEKPQILIDFIENVPLTIEEWKHQKEIYSTCNNKYSVELGLATFYLNRTNHSGILAAGPIGGQRQSGKYCLDARFNRKSLKQKIINIANNKSKLIVYNKEIRSFIEDVIPKYENEAFVYFDPPYFNKGQHLYKNFLTPEDHKKISCDIIKKVTCPWIISYDDVLELREMYSGFKQFKYNLNYSAANKGVGSEIMIFKSESIIPSFEIANKIQIDFEPCNMNKL